MSWGPNNFNFQLVLSYRLHPGVRWTHRILHFLMVTVKQCNTTSVLLDRYRRSSISMWLDVIQWRFRDFRERRWTICLSICVCLSRQRYHGRPMDPCFAAATCYCFSQITTLMGKEERRDLCRSLLDLPAVSLVWMEDLCKGMNG